MITGQSCIMQWMAWGQLSNYFGEKLVRFLYVNSTSIKQGSEGWTELYRILVFSAFEMKEWGSHKPKNLNELNEGRLKMQLFWKSVSVSRKVDLFCKFSQEHDKFEVAAV